MKTIIICVLLSVASSQVISITNCAIADLVNSVCLVCKPNFQLISGQCNQCLPNYLLTNGACVYNTSAASSSSATTYTNGVQVVSVTSDSVLITALEAYLQQRGSSSNIILQSSPCTTTSNGVCISCSQGYTLTNNICVSSANSNSSTLTSSSSSSSLLVPTTVSNTPGLTTSSTAQIQSSSQQTSASTSSSSTSTVITGSNSTALLSTTTTKPSTSSITSTSSASIFSTTSAASNQNVVFLPFFVSPTFPGLVTLTNSTQSTYENYDNNCKTFDTVLGVCSLCYNGYYYNTGSQSCVATNPLCQNVTSNNLCTSCYIGYTLYNGNCIIDSNYNIINDQNCKTRIINTNICLACYPGYFLNQSQNRCDRANPNCKTVTSLNTCSSCYQGYQLSNNECVTATSVIYTSGQTDQFCSKFVNDTCLSCSNRYYLASNGKCMQIDPFCQNYTSKGVCLLCYVGYKVFNGGCILLNIDSPYQTPSEGAVECPMRTVLIGSSCVKVNDQCRTWSMVNALCTSCYRGYYLTTAGACAVY